MPRQTRDKPIEFTHTNPLNVTIQFNSITGEWDIQPDPKLHAAHMDTRLHKELDGAGNNLETNLSNQWSGRHALNGPKYPHFLDPSQKGKHTPILMREGEVVRFTCNLPFPFEIWADRDPGVDAIPGAPNNPFGWQSPQSVGANGSLTAVVVAPPLDNTNTPTQDGPTEQRFYKFTAWVHTNDGLFLIDPDGSCDR